MFSVSASAVVAAEAAAAFLLAAEAAAAFLPAAAAFFLSRWHVLLGCASPSLDWAEISSSGEDCPMGAS